MSGLSLSPLESPEAPEASQLPQGSTKIREPRRGQRSILVNGVMLVIFVVSLQN
jgi:hypothetical protein